MAGINTNLRLSGLSSGMDTDIVVKGMLSLYQAKIDKQQQTNTKLNWTADAYREVNTLIKNFRSKHMSVLTGTNMMSSLSYSDYSVKMMSDTNAVSISANSSANEGTVTINSITELAESVSIKSLGVFKGTAYSSDLKLSDIQLEQAFVFDENGEIKFSINGKDFTFTADNTIGELTNAVNSSGAGVRMSYSSLTKGFTLINPETGFASEIAIVNTAGNAFSAGGALGIEEGTYNGKDAQLLIDNVPVTRATNTFTIDGITYTLSGKTNDPITFSVNRDVDATVKRIKEFVDSYNELVGKLQGKVEEKAYRKFPPLTDTQKEEMTDKEIEKWEEKSKSGMLYNDPYVSSLLTTLRSAFYTEIEGSGMMLSDIGLNTGLYYEGAKINVDENKLRSAIAADPQKIKDLFTKDADGFNGSGLIVRISDAMLSYTKQSTSVALESLGDRISNTDKRIQELQSQMEDREAVLWQRFSAMESAMSKLNSMSGWLSNMLSGVSSNK